MVLEISFGIWSLAPREGISLNNDFVGFSPYKPKPIPPVTSADRQANAKIFQRCLEMKNIELLNSLSSYHQYLILKIESERLRKGNLERLMPKPGAWLKYRK